MGQEEEEGRQKTKGSLQEKTTWGRRKRKVASRRRAG
jgi:hypothetical protein